MIIALSFETFAEVIDNYLTSTTPQASIKVLEFLFVYSFIITSWFHTHLTALSGHPYRNIQGSTRFLLDLTVLFLLYYIMNKIDVNNNEAFADAFPFTFFLIFLFYGVWEALRYYQFRNIPSQTIGDDKLRATLWMITFFGALVLFYHFYITPANELGDAQLIGIVKSLGELVVILYGFIPLVLYRWYMWDVTDRIRRARRRHNATIR